MTDKFAGTERVTAQLSRWRQGPTFGLMENKLLAHSLLDALHVPQPEVIYGAFATKPLGRWPAYSRANFTRALHGKRHFVLKSATNGGNSDVLVMTPARWEAESWNPAKLIDFVERFVRREHVKAKWWSEWGQVFEHRAVIVQESLSPKSREGFGCSEGELILEAKVHAPLGVLASGRLQALPFDSNSYLDVTFEAAGAIRCLGGRNLANATALCSRAVRLLLHHRTQLEAVAAKVTRALGADWMRLDVFLSEAGLFSVNELSYPSHIGAFTGGGDSLSIDPLVNAYKTKQLTRAPSATFLAPLFAACGIDAYDFLLAADFRGMRHASEATYASQLWQWDPAEEDEVNAVHLIKSAWCTTTLLVGVGLLLLVAWWLPKVHGAAKAERSETLDNAKFMCSSLIIFGHFCYYNMDHSTHLHLVDYQTWLQNAGPTLHFVLTITNWRITLACFISGHLMARPFSTARFESFLKNLVLPTLLWVFIAKPLILPLLSGNIELSVALQRMLSTLMAAKAHHNEWYLEALILWRLLSFAMGPLRGRYAVFLALCISYMGGYWDIGENGFFSWDHAIGYLPYFIAGWATPLDRLTVAIPQTPRTIAIGLTLTIGLPILMTHLEPLPDHHGTYGWFWAASEFEETQKLAAKGAWLAYRLYWTRRAAKNVFEIAQALAVLLTLVPRSKIWFTPFGKHTLYAFLLHEVVLGWRNHLVAVLPLPVLTSPLAHVLVLASQYVVCVAICVALCSYPTRRVFGLVLEPTWLSQILFVSSNPRRPTEEVYPLISGNDATSLEEGKSGKSGLYDGQRGVINGKPLSSLATLETELPLRELEPFCLASYSIKAPRGTNHATKSIAPLEAAECVETVGSRGCLDRVCEGTVQPPVAKGGLPIYALPHHRAAVQSSHDGRYSVCHAAMDTAEVCRQRDVGVNVRCFDYVPYLLGLYGVCVPCRARLCDWLRRRHLRSPLPGTQAAEPADRPTASHARRDHLCLQGAIRCARAHHQVSTQQPSRQQHNCHPCHRSARRGR